MSDEASNYRAWMNKADHDLLNIENNLAADAVPWDTICFRAQQAGEKYLKAFLVHHGSMPPRIHDLLGLLALCLRVDESLHILEQACDVLTPYAAAARYPSDILEADAKMGREAYEAAVVIKDVIWRKMPKTE